MLATTPYRIALRRFPRIYIQFLYGIILVFRRAPEHRLLFFAFTIPEQVRCFVPQIYQQRIRVRSMLLNLPLTEFHQPATLIESK